MEVKTTVSSKDALIVTAVVELTGLLVSVKTDWYEPSGTVTVVGTGIVDGLLLLNAIVVPPAGAELLRKIAAVTESPPTMVEAINEAPPSMGTTASVFD